jgi:hypothetical protein
LCCAATNWPFGQKGASLQGSNLPSACYLYTRERRKTKPLVRVYSNHDYAGEAKASFEKWANYVTGLFPGIRLHFGLVRSRMSLTRDRILY